MEIIETARKEAEKETRYKKWTFQVMGIQKFMYNVTRLRVTRLNMLALPAVDKSATLTMLGSVEFATGQSLVHLNSTYPGVWVQDPKSVDLQSSGDQEGSQSDLKTTTNTGTPPSNLKRSKTNLEDTDQDVLAVSEILSTLPPKPVKIQRQSQMTYSEDHHPQKGKQKDQEKDTSIPLKRSQAVPQRIPLKNPSTTIEEIDNSTGDSCDGSEMEEE